MNTPLNMHAARTALNQNQKLRSWAEDFLKGKERAATPAMTDAEFEKHWLYVRPERMHEGAIEAVTAYNQLAERLGGVLICWRQFADDMESVPGALATGSQLTHDP
jgi:hypothetical protein